MTPDTLLRLALVILTGACFGYAAAMTRKARRIIREAEAFHAATKAQLDRAGDLLAHLMRDHAVLHSDHSHPDDSHTLQ